MRAPSRTPTEHAESSVDLPCPPHGNLHPGEPSKTDRTARQGATVTCYRSRPAAPRPVAATTHPNTTPPPTARTRAHRPPWPPARGPGTSNGRTVHLTRSDVLTAAHPSPCAPSGERGRRPGCAGGCRPPTRGADRPSWPEGSASSTKPPPSSRSNAQRGQAVARGNARHRASHVPLGGERAPVAQRTEHRITDPGVGGSSPSRRTAGMEQEWLAGLISRISPAASAGPAPMSSPCGRRSTTA